MNRFKITEKGISLAKEFMSGKINKTASPSFVKKFGPELTVNKNGKVLYKGIPLIPLETRDTFYRTEMLKKNSLVPLNKAGFFQLQKIGWGLTRKSWMDFLKKQRVIRNMDRAPPEQKKKGRKAHNMREFQTDLMEIRTSQLPKPLKTIKDSYVCVTVHRVTSLLDAVWIPNKKPQTATPKVIQSITKMSELLGLPKSERKIVVSDFGFEFDSAVLRKNNILHKPSKIAHSAEAAIGKIRRHLFKHLKLKKGGFASTLQQVVDILNKGLRSKVSGKTPHETALSDQKKTLEKFNSKRQGGTGAKRRMIEVGDRVRLSLRNKKDVMYKSNSEVQWDKMTYIVKGKSKNGTSFKLHVLVRKNNKWQRIWKWISGDRIQKIPKRDDTKTERLLENRLQSGTEKKQYVRKKPVVQAPKPPRRSSRVAKRAK
jgi:hypothetical protein